MNLARNMRKLVGLLNYWLFVLWFHELAVCEHALVIKYLIDLLIVYIVRSFIYKNISILYLSLDLIYFLSKLAIIGEFLDVLHYIFIITTECFMRNVSGIERLNNMVIEFEPLFIWGLSILNEWVVVSLLSCAHMDHNSLKIIVVVLIRNLSVEDSLVFFIQFIFSNVLFFHFLNDILLWKVVLTILIHIQLVRKFAVVVNFELCHSVKVEFKPFKHKDQDIRHSFDATPFQSVYLLVTLFTEVSIITF